MHPVLYNYSIMGSHKVLYSAKTLKQHEQKHKDYEISSIFQPIYQGDHGDMIMSCLFHSAFDQNGKKKNIYTV